MNTWTPSSHGENWCVECSMDNADRKCNKARDFKCPRCGEWTDEENDGPMVGEDNSPLDR